MGKRKAQQYSEEFKQSSAKLAFESEQSVSTRAKELGIYFPTLYGWIAKYYPKDKSLKGNRDKNLEVELKQLKKELARTKQERYILKKAAAYFASLLT